jgi:hypothetical protein
VVSNRICLFLITDCRPLISDGAIAQLGERLLCKQEVVGSIPSGSTRPAAVRPVRPARAACGSRRLRVAQMPSRCCVRSNAARPEVHLFARDVSQVGSPAWDVAVRVV